MSLKRSEVGTIPTIEPTQSHTRSDMMRIIDRVYDIDLMKVYERLEHGLRMGEDRTEYQFIVVHLDQGETNARDAHRLYLAARLEREKFEHEYEPTRAAMWERAVAMLQKEKDSGERRKQITDSDVRAMISSMFPEEWTTFQLRLTKFVGTEEHLKELADIWKGRCKTLQTILNTLRRTST